LEFDRTMQIRLAYTIRGRGDIEPEFQGGELLQKKVLTVEALSKSGGSIDGRRRGNRHGAAGCIGPQEKPNFRRLGECDELDVFLAKVPR
jgi:hypothetical protein